MLRGLAEHISFNHTDIKQCQADRNFAFTFLKGCNFMADSTIALFIVLVVLILYATELLPIFVTSIFAIAAFIFTGILTPAQAFSGFSNVATLLAAAAMILGVALGETGATELLSRRLSGLVGLSKRSFYTILCGLSALLSACLSSFGIIIIMMAVADSIIVESNYKFNKRGCYMPIAIGASIGGAISLSGSGSVLAACAAYNQYVGYDAIGYFTPAILAVPACIGAILFYITIGTKLSEKWFDFEETPIQLKAPPDCVKDERKKKRDMYISIITFVACAAFWAFTKVNLALTGMMGVCVLVVLRAIQIDEALKKVNWTTLIILACTLGFASGVHESGADTVISEFVLAHSGPLANTPVGMFIIVLLLTIILTNIMSNTGAAAILAPIAITLAEKVGGNAMLWCIAIGVGANCAIATPIGCANMTILLPAGYRFKDFVKVGVCVCVLSMILVTAVYAVIV